MDTLSNILAIRNPYTRTVFRSISTRSSTVSLQEVAQDLVYELLG